jgi:hypothetical protein
MVYANLFSFELIPLFTIVVFSCPNILGWMCKAVLLKAVLQSECSAATFKVEALHLGMLGIIARFLPSHYGSVAADNGTNGIKVVMKSAKPMTIIVELVGAVRYLAAGKAHINTIREDDLDVFCKDN